MTADHPSGATHHAADFVAGALADRIGAEMAQLAELAVALQDTLTGFATNATADPQTIREVQSLDRLTQVLQDLTRVMAALAVGLPKDLRISAPPVLRVIRLYDLSRTLSAPDPRGAMPAADTGGDVAWL
jgi:hypothetical protein